MGDTLGQVLARRRAQDPLVQSGELDHHCLLLDWNGRHGSSSRIAQGYLSL